ncbi:MAG: LacI family transcriptional regulator [Phycisphaerae bacterium]|nr:LacI family transcriptional regulator [Phycisphaerae bacterium]
MLNRKSKPIEVSKATRKRIFQAAKEMNYSPNLLARGLRKGKTQTIGFLAGTPKHEILSAQVMILDQLVDKAGYRLYISYTMGELDRMVETANELVSRGVDGLILRGAFPGVSTEQLQSRLSFPVPTVFVESQVPFPCRQVYQDGAVGVKQAVDHLYALGHRHIHMVRTYWNGWERALRFRGFREAIDSYGLGKADEKLHEIDAWTCHMDKNGHTSLDIDTVSRRMKGLLKSYPDCTAILCHDDELALVVLLCLSHLGIKVPEDISVVGFDNIPATLTSHPPLSTVVKSIGNVIRTAFDLLMEEIDNKQADPQEVVIPSEFISRQSTGPVRTTKVLDFVA